jgi:hypothetical protein
MTGYEVCYIPYNIIYHYPTVLFTGMLLDLLHRNERVCHFFDKATIDRNNPLLLETQINLERS